MHHTALDKKSTSQQFINHFVGFDGVRAVGLVFQETTVFNTVIGDELFGDDDRCTRHQLLHGGLEAQFTVRSGRSTREINPRGSELQ